MSWDPLEFLDVARSLGRTTEGHCRTTVSRAYYATFLKARDNLAARNLLRVSRGGGDHGAVLEALRRARRTQAALQLRMLRDKRATADYDTGASVSVKEAEEAVALAEEIERLLGVDWGVTSS